jgi:four helix bundle protein
MVVGMDKKKITSFFDLVSWQISHEIVLEVYSLTKTLPKDELFGLVSQMRRAAVSVTSNIAEGFSRHTKDGKNQFYYSALGSLTELQNQLRIALDVGYIKEPVFDKLLAKSERAQKLIYGLTKTAPTRPIPSTNYHLPTTRKGAHK